jgi:hypothetical protein
MKYRYLAFADSSPVIKPQRPPTQVCCKPQQIPRNPLVHDSVPTHGLNCCCNLLLPRDTPIEVSWNSAEIKWLALAGITEVILTAYSHFPLHAPQQDFDILVIASFSTNLLVEYMWCSQRLNFLLPCAVEEGDISKFQSSSLYFPHQAS